MGTWGPGNFENDTAAEYLIDLCRPLIAQITHTVAHPELMEPDEGDSDIMLANIEILAVLAESIGRTENGWPGDIIFPFPFPPAEEIEQWKRHYLTVWDRYIDKLRPDPEYKQKRRALIVTTFDRLLHASNAGPPRPLD